MMNRTSKLPRAGAILWAFVLLGLVSGCQAHQYVAGNRLDNPALRDKLEVRLAEMYPDEFEVTLKIALTHRDKRYDYIGFIHYRDGANFRAVAQGEMGGKVFDFEARHGNYKVIKKPMLLPEKPLRDGAVYDIKLLYDWARRDNAYLVGRAEGVVGLIMPHNNEQFKEYLFDRHQRLLSSVEVDRGQVTRAVTYGDFRRLQHWRRPIPTRIVLNDYSWHYSVEINTLQIHPFGKK